MPANETARVAFCVLTVLPEELEALQKQFKPTELQTLTRTYHRAQVERLDGKGSHDVAIATASSPGNSEMQSLVHDVIADLQPTWLVLAGIAGGRPSDDFTLGDVVAGTHVHDFSLAKVSTGMPMEHDIRGGPLSTRAASYVSALNANSAFQDWSAPDAIGIDLPELDLNAVSLYGPVDWQASVRDSLALHFPAGEAVRRRKLLPGPIASSDTLITSPEHLITWLRVARKTLAVEMEAAGLLKAAGSRVPAVILRGISDIVGLRRSDDWKRYACATAASAARHFVATFGDVLDTSPSRAGKGRAPRATADASELARVHSRAAKILRSGGRGEIQVDRDRLHTLISWARSIATTDAVSLGGDLSWTQQDAAFLKLLRTARPMLRLIVFYDKTRVGVDAAKTIAELEDCGIQFKPYPLGLGWTSRTKCIVLDHDTDRARLYTFRRVDGPIGPGGKSLLFKWREHKTGTEPLMEAVRLLTKAFTSASPDPVSVAICGVNNVGKSTLAIKLKAALRKQFVVDLVPDVFREVAGVATTDNYVMLWRQRDRESMAASAGVRIYDRCIVDNFCYMKMRDGGTVTATLAGDVAAAARRYDVLVDVARSDGNYSAGTTYVTGSERAQARRILEQFYSDHHLEPYRISLDPQRWEASIEKAVDVLAERVKAIALQRHFATTDR